MKDKKIRSAIILCGGMSKRMGEDKGSMKIDEKPMIIHVLETLNYQIDEAIIVLNDCNRIFKYKSLIQEYINNINNIKNINNINNIKNINNINDVIKDWFNFNVIFVEDEIKNKGPLSGIMSGLKVISSDYGLILPCDSPYITSDFVNYMFNTLTILNSKDTVDGIVPYHNNEDDTYDNLKKTILKNSEPLHSIYKKETYPIIENLLKSNKKQVKSFINLINCHFIPINNDSNSKINEINFKNINYKNDL